MSSEDDDFSAENKSAGLAKCILEQKKAGHGQAGSVCPLHKSQTHKVDQLIHFFIPAGFHLMWPVY